MSAQESLLDVRDLAVSFETPVGRVDVVEGLTLEVGRGETVAVVGESGSGKSVTCLAIMGLLPTPPATVSGRVVLSGRDLLGLSAAEINRVRGKELAMIFQEPMTSLNPVFPVGWQIAESLRHHDGLSAKEAQKRVVELLDLVGIPEPGKRARAYPHQLSGGMRQRVMIAIALACKPDVLIADEPTTALDVTIQAQVLELLRSLQQEFGMGLLFVTHDLGVVAEIADRVLVMYSGRCVESGSVSDVFSAPAMPYTSGLLGSVPVPGAARDRLATIEGEVPDPGRRPPGCAFHPRCDSAEAACAEAVPDLEQFGGARQVRCRRWRELSLSPSAAGGGA